MATVGVKGLKKDFQQRRRIVDCPVGAQPCLLSTFHFQYNAYLLAAMDVSSKLVLGQKILHCRAERYVTLLVVRSTR